MSIKKDMRTFVMTTKLAMWRVNVEILYFGWSFGILAQRRARRRMAAEVRTIWSAPAIEIARWCVVNERRSASQLKDSVVNLKQGYGVASRFQKFHPPLSTCSANIRVKNRSLWRTRWRWRAWWEAGGVWGKLEQVEEVETEERGGGEKGCWERDKKMRNSNARGLQPH